MLALFITIIAVYTTLTVIRLFLSIAEIKKQQRNIVDISIKENDITVLQPILGGDKALADCLLENLRNSSNANFIWLLDEGDDLGIKAAKQALKISGRNDVKLIINQCPPVGVNPKMWKLAKGFKEVSTTFFSILDDDTILPKGTLPKAATIANSGNLVTGLPLYASRFNILSRLVTGFVNANSLLTYLPANYLGLSNTINGMFTVMRTKDINSTELSSISEKVTDDYALARLFKEKELGIKQTILYHPIITTVTSFKHYNHLMKRWFVFARIYLKENMTFSLFMLVVLPAILPLPMVILSTILSGFAVTLVFILLMLKAFMVHKIYASLGDKKTPISDIIFEITAELLSPIHATWALLRPGKITWRKRQFILKGAKIIDG
ncbi:MAG: glycosyltransferase [Pseudomonadota bacterium]